MYDSKLKEDAEGSVPLNRPRGYMKAERRKEKARRLREVAEEENITEGSGALRKKDWRAAPENNPTGSSEFRQPPIVRDG